MMSPNKPPQDRVCTVQLGVGHMQSHQESVRGEKQPHTKELSLPHFNLMGQSAEYQCDNDVSF